MIPPFRRCHAGRADRARTQSVSLLEWTLAALRGPDHCVDRALGGCEATHSALPGNSLKARSRPSHTLMLGGWVNIARPLWFEDPPRKTMPRHRDRRTPQAIDPAQATSGAGNFLTNFFLVAVIVENVG